MADIGPDPHERTRKFVTQILDGDRAATSELMPHVYAQLRRMASTYLDDRKDVLTLQPTALVHEAFLQLRERDEWEGKAHFLAVAAKAMRDILVDHLRRRGAQKRGGNGQWSRVTLQSLASDGADDVDLIALHQALEDLAELDPRQAEIVEMRYFGGMTGQEIATAAGVSRNTVVRELKTAKAWLLRALDGAD